MSIIGIDFGSHTASLAIWFEEKNEIEVIADDLGFRTIPCCVAYRGDEVITGQAAISQQHKNTSNTFDDVRSMFLDATNQKKLVPLLEKEITVEEIGSHFFRNIHNQIKQQVGKIVRDCVVSMPDTFSEDLKKRIIESAQAGGIRIKTFIKDSAATLLAYNLDTSNPLNYTIVIDIGWKSVDIALYRISDGLFFPLANTSTTTAGGYVFVQLLAEHCAKEFTKKKKVSCLDNAKAMMRLKRECEVAMKSLSTGTEATIDIDSLCEGMDYSSKISRARFEDLITIPFIQIKNLINETLTATGIVPSQIAQVCLSGGPSSMPKVMNMIQVMFPSAIFPKGRFESSETQCIGAALHGKYLIEQGLIDHVPTESPLTPCLSSSIYLASTDTSSVNSSGFNGIEIISKSTVLPTKMTIPAILIKNHGFFQIVLGNNEPSDPKIVAGEVTFQMDGTDLNAEIQIQVSEIGEIVVEVVQVCSKIIVGNLVIPSGMKK